MDRETIVADSESIEVMTVCLLFRASPAGGFALWGVFQDRAAAKKETVRQDDATGQAKDWIFETHQVRS